MAAARRSSPRRGSHGDKCAPRATIGRTEGSREDNSMSRPVVSSKTEWSKTWTFFEDDWHEGNVPIMGPRTHGAWLGTSVFDGARAFEGVTPDLDLHCARINKSVKAMCLKPVVTAGAWIALVARGPQAFRPRCRALYPADVLGRGGRAGRGAARSGIDALVPDAFTTRRCRKPTGTAITLSPFRRPTRECAPLDAKAGCLYPNNARALIEARSAASTIASCATCWATSPNSAPPIFSW